MSMHSYSPAGVDPSANSPKRAIASRTANRRSMSTARPSKRLRHGEDETLPSAGRRGRLLPRRRRRPRRRFGNCRRAASIDSPWRTAGSPTTRAARSRCGGSPATGRLTASEVENQFAELVSIHDVPAVAATTPAHAPLRASVPPPRRALFAPRSPHQSLRHGLSHLSARCRAKHQEGHVEPRPVLYRI